MSKLIYKDQSAFELEYNLLISPDSVSNFNILESKSLKWQSQNITFSIIGSSHFVEINTGSNLKYIELLACIESGNIASETVLHKKALLDDKELQYSRRLSQNLVYKFETTIIDDKVESKQQFFKKYQSNNTDLDIYHVFPAIDGLAITSIEIIRQDSLLLWITYHSYPGESLIIKTDSYIERGGL